jgi:hypothetical protein
MHQARDVLIAARRLTPLLLGIGVLLLLGRSTASRADRGASLEILWTKTLSTQLSPPTEVRWAGGRSVYLSRVLDGIAELDLPGLAVRRLVIPDSKAVKGFPGFTSFGASGKNVVAAAPFNDLIVRSLDRQFDNGTHFLRHRAGVTDALDLSGDRLLLLGLPAVEVQSVRNGFGPTGAIAWLGSVQGLWEAEGLHPLLKDIAGPGVRSFDNCSSIPLGAARFLADGTALVVPGVQPGIHLFSSSGRLLRTWDSQALGIDGIDCAALDPHRAHHDILRLPGTRADFLNAHRVVDEILPLPEGPGLVIRYVDGGKVHWLLKVLQSGSRVLTYEIPLTGDLPFERLTGDVRNEQIVLLVSGREREVDRPQIPARLVLARVPGSVQGAGR